MGTDTLARLQWCSIYSNLEVPVADQFTPPSAVQDLRWENLKNQKFIKFPPKTLSSPLKQNRTHGESAILRKQSSALLRWQRQMEHSDNPGFLRKYRAWKTVPTHLATQPYIRHWTKITNTEKSIFPRKIYIKPLSRDIMDSFDFRTCCSDWRVRQRRFNKQMNLYLRKWSSVLPLPVSTILWYFHIRWTNISTMFEKLNVIIRRKLDIDSKDIGTSRICIHHLGHFVPIGA